MSWMTVSDRINWRIALDVVLGAAAGFTVSSLVVHWQTLTLTDVVLDFWFLIMTVIVRLFSGMMAQRHAAELRVLETHQLFGATLQQRMREGPLSMRWRSTNNDEKGTHH